MVHVLHLLLAAAVAAPAARECARAVPSAVIEARIGHAERAYAALLGAADEEAAWRTFTAHLEAVREALPCTGEVLSPALAARLHAVEGLKRYGEHDLHGASLAWGAARRADPSTPLGAGWMHSGDPERAVWDAVRVEGGSELRLPRPRRGVLVLDGRPVTTRTDAWPVVWQQVRANGAVVVTRYLPQGGPTPPYRRAAPRGAWALTGAGVGLAVGGSAMLATSLAYWTRACRERAQGGCHAADGLSGAQVHDLVEVGVPVGAAVAGVGLAVSTGGALWVALSGRPGAAHVAVGGTFQEVRWRTGTASRR